MSSLSSTRPLFAPAWNMPAAFGITALLLIQLHWNVCSSLFPIFSFLFISALLMFLNRLNFNVFFCYVDLALLWCRRRQKLILFWQLKNGLALFHCQPSCQRLCLSAVIMLCELVIPHKFPFAPLLLIFPLFYLLLAFSRILSCSFSAQTVSSFTGHLVQVFASDTFFSSSYVVFFDFLNFSLYQPI